MRDKQMKKMQMGDGILKKTAILGGGICETSKLIGRWREDADEAFFPQLVCCGATYTTAAPPHRGDESTHKQSHTTVPPVRCGSRY